MGVSDNTRLVIDMSRYNNQPGDPNDVRKVAFDVLAQNLVPALVGAEKVSGERRIIVNAEVLNDYIRSAPSFNAVFTQDQIISETSAPGSCDPFFGFVFADDIHDVIVAFNRGLLFLVV
jgi:phage-related baseplate assembly protein